MQDLKKYIKGKQKMLKINNLCVEIEEKEIIHNLNLNIEKKEDNIIALMGPNGSGKSTLANVIIGNPGYKITRGELYYKNKSLLKLTSDERAKLGLFMSFQYPSEIEGVTLRKFLRQAYNNLHKKKISIFEFDNLLKEKAKVINFDISHLDRDLNLGFSGGEKKKSEILQLLVLNPDFAILDETDSGLDIDALKAVANGVDIFMKQKNKKVLIITHYKRILELVKPNKVFIMLNGDIVERGGYDLVNKLESHGYKWLDKGEKPNGDNKNGDLKKI